MGGMGLRWRGWGEERKKGRTTRPTILRALAERGAEDPGGVGRGELVEREHHLAQSGKMVARGMAGGRLVPPCRYHGTEG